MARQQSPVLRQRLFEARYDQGYRYLDRCGDVMVILEGALGEKTGRLWLTQETVPTGARLQCPELDATVVLNAYHLAVDQSPVGELVCEFDEIVEIALATAVGRFDIRKMRRYGARQIKVLPAQTDSIEEAERLSLRLPHASHWDRKTENGFEFRSSEQTVVFELPDRSKGFRVVTRPFHKVGADVKVDDRLKLPPHLLPDGQHEALTEQLRRRKQRQHDPEAGALIDIDYYSVCPPRDWTVHDFLAEAWQEAERLEAALLSGRR